MSEYIERATVLQILAANLSIFEDSDESARVSMVDIYALPALDVMPVRHGCWQITQCYPHNVYCSECHTKFAQTHWTVWKEGSLPRNYCPNCGAKMDGGT